VTFCAQEKFPEPTTAKERRRVQWSVCESK
jgi:hypothetical protein